MQIEEARKIILESTKGNDRIERSVENDFVRLNDRDYTDPILLLALEEMLKSEVLEQLPTAGQSRTTVAYRRNRAAK
jgi:hypothetical protein